MNDACAGVTTRIAPPQLHINKDVFCSAGTPLINTPGLQGTQGAAVWGTQGMGVRTPNAAAVAAATAGLAGQLHIPNGEMFTRGTLSFMVATGSALADTPEGST